MLRCASVSIVDLLSRAPIPAIATIARRHNTPVVVVGGAVRDALLGRTSHDLDFSVQGDAVALARACANSLDGAFYVMDAARGVARVLLGNDASPRLVLDFVKCRGASWQADLLDRDFTLNAIAYDIDSGSLIDPLHGSTDIAAKRVRAVGPNSVASDPVRAVRGVRIARQLGFSIESTTRDQMRAAARHLNGLSAERLRDALADLLKLPDAGTAIGELEGLGLLAALLPETVAMRAERLEGASAADVLAHTLQVSAALDGILAGLSAFGELHTALSDHLSAAAVEGRTRVVTLRLAGLLHDCAKPQTRAEDASGAVRYDGHEAAGAGLAAARAAALRFSADECAQLKVIVALHGLPNQLSQMAPAEFAREAHRFLQRAGDCAPDVALLALADRAGKAAGAVPETVNRLLQSYFQRYAPLVSPPPLITGNDLLSLGMKPGPQVGAILERIREAQMLDEIATHDEAKHLARTLIAVPMQ